MPIENTAENSAEVLRVFDEFSDPNNTAEHPHSSVPELILVDNAEEFWRQNHGEGDGEYGPDEDWRERRACSDVDTKVFFPIGKEYSDRIAAIRICRNCVVIQECLEYAVNNEIDDGIWGGKTEEERRRIRKKREEAQRRSRRAV